MKKLFILMLLIIVTTACVSAQRLNYLRLVDNETNQILDEKPISIWMNIYKHKIVFDTGAAFYLNSVKGKNEWYATDWNGTACYVKFFTSKELKSDNVGGLSIYYSNYTFLYLYYER